MSDFPCGQVHPEGLVNVFPARVVVGFVGKVPDLGHKGKNIPEAAEQEGSMQLYPNLMGVFWKRRLHHFPILESQPSCCRCDQCLNSAWWTRGLSLKPMRCHNLTSAQISWTCPSSNSRP